MSRTSSTDLMSMLSTLDQRALQFKGYYERTALTALALALAAFVTFFIVFPADLPGLLLGGVDIPAVLIEGKDAPFKAAIDIGRQSTGLSAAMIEGTHAATNALSGIVAVTGTMFITFGLFRLFVVV